MSGPGFPNVVSNTLHKLSATWNGLPGGTKLLRPCLSWGEGRPQRPQALFYCRPQRQGQLLGGAFPSAHCLPPCLLQPARSGCTTPCLVLPVQFRWHRICAYRVTPHAMSGNCTNPSPQLPCSRSRLRPKGANGKPPERAAPAHSSSNPAAGPPGNLQEAAGQPEDESGGKGGTTRWTVTEFVR